MCAFRSSFFVFDFVSPDGVSVQCVEGMPDIFVVSCGWCIALFAHCFVCGADSWIRRVPCDLVQIVRHLYGSCVVWVVFGCVSCDHGVDGLCARQW